MAANQEIIGLTLESGEVLVQLVRNVRLLMSEREKYRRGEGGGDVATIELAVLAADITDATTMSVKLAYYDVTTKMPVARDGAEAFTAHAVLLYHTDTLIDGPDRDPPVEDEYTQPRLGQGDGVYVKYDAVGTAKARETDPDADEVWLVVGHFRPSTTKCPEA